MITEIAAIGAAVVGIVNILMYVFGFFRKLENNYQADLSAINARLNKLEGQIDVLVNKSD